MELRQIRLLPVNILCTISKDLCHVIIFKTNDSFFLYTPNGCTFVDFKVHPFQKHNCTILNHFHHLKNIHMEMCVCDIRREKLADINIQICCVIYNLNIFSNIGIFLI